MAAPSKTFTVISDARVDADSPWDETVTEDLRDNDIYLEEWLGKDYVADQNHSHDGVGSALLAADSIDDTQFDVSPASTSNQVIGAAGTYTPGAGFYNFADTATSLYFQINSGGLVGGAGNTISGTYICDGAGAPNMQVVNGDGGNPHTLYWQKFG